jgi:hypothetical protein
MAAIDADPDIPASRSLAPRGLEECLRTLEECGRARLAPLAQHMAAKRLVRARRRRRTSTASGRGRAARGPEPDALLRVG